jgi:hypothetical protein
MPTIKQQLVVQKFAENFGKPKTKRKTAGEILKEVGYSESTQKSPDKITKTLTFRELLKKTFPDSKITKLQNNLINASRPETMSIEPSFSDKNIKKIINAAPGFKVIEILRERDSQGRESVKVFYLCPDNLTRRAALDMLYKLDNKYPKDKEESDANSAVKAYIDKLATVLP